MLAPMWGAVRRLAGLATAGVLAAGLAGCAGIGQPAPYDSQGINGLVIPTPSPDPDDFVDAVDNPWLALEPGAAWRYTVTKDGRTVGTIDAEVLDTTTEVAGLTATAVRTTTDLDGADRDDRDVEETRFYAQDDDGNVWLVGADSFPGASWRAGEGNAEAGLAMPADPRLGDGWLAFRLADGRENVVRIEDQSRQMLQTRDEAGTATRRVYESGVGLVSVEALDAGWLAVRER
ncbi:hypothetical protein HN031_12055 [Nocardioides sp. zg-1308]|uniref:hypothetical protein n=1 Tax=Nocardioides sp. zg-1308 TaxID=2736253 RepID=UPI001557D51C|nr:hypothetical protein [Nocardioides sp. zg-1308]NPD05417.1 hypothetical protein [Nocardioides sp. zg-1308]